MFFLFIALQMAKENKRIHAIQKLLAISSPLKLIPIISLRLQSQ